MRMAKESGSLEWVERQLGDGTHVVRLIIAYLETTQVSVLQQDGDV
jgi:hypothetical protein